MSQRVRRGIWGVALGIPLLVMAGLLGACSAAPPPDDRAYPGSQGSGTADEIFADYDLTFPTCTDGRMRYWVGYLDDLYLKITAPPDCVSQFIDANKLGSSEPFDFVPVHIANNDRAVKLGWRLPAGHTYTSHNRRANRRQIISVSNDAPEQSLFLRGWHE